MLAKFLRKLFFGFLMFLCGAYTIGSVALAVAAPFMEEEATVVIVVTGAIMALLFGWLTKKCWQAYKRPPRREILEQQKKAEAEAAAQKQKEREKLEAEVAKLTVLPVIAKPSGIILKPGEICHYQAPASLRVAVHAGGRGSSAWKEEAHTYSGVLIITSQRIVLIGEKGFDQQIKRLTSLLPFGQTGIILQFGNSSYTVLMEEPFWVPKIIELINDPSAEKVQRLQVVE